MLSVMAGPHPRDPLCLPDDGVSYLAATRRSIAGLRVGYSPDFGSFPVDRQVAAVVADAVEAFELAGARVEEVSVRMPRSQQELAALWVRMVGVLYAADFAAFKRQGIDLLGEHRADMTPQFVEMVEAAGRMNVLEYKADDELRTEVFDAIQDVFDSYDLLVTPTLAIPPVDNAADGNTLGPTRIDGEPVDPLIGWCLTYPVNFSGHPAASIPAGLTSEGLPVGLQIVAPRFADDTLLAASAAFERARPWHHLYPR